MTQHIVIVDCDQIQRYITRSGRLRDIKGASARLAWVNETLTEGLLPQLFHAGGAYGNVDYPDHPYHGDRELVDSLTVSRGDCDYQLLFSAGGITKVVFAEAADAQSFVEAVRRLYNDELPGTEITVHIEECNAAGGLGEAIGRGESEVRRKKDNKSGARPVVSLPFFQLCAACGQEPAQFVDRHAPGLPVGSEYPLICPVCRHKREFRPGTAQWKQSPLAQFQERLCLELTCNAGVEQVAFPRDFEGVAGGALVAEGDEQAKEDAHDTGSYLALVCADGNNMGQIVSRAQPAEYRSFSLAVKEATAEALHEAAVAVLADALREPADGGPSIAPFQPLILGGDDIVCVVRAEKALSLAAQFVDRFVKKTASNPAILPVLERMDWEGIEGDRRCIPIAVGIAIAGAKFPFHDLHELAEHLLREAKARCRQQAAVNPLCCAVDFQVVTSPRAMEFDDLKALRSAGALGVSCRPYAVHDDELPPLDGLLCAIRILQRAQFPRGKISALPGIVRRGQGAGEVGYKEWLQRMVAGHKAAWQRACEALGLTENWELWPALDGAGFAEDLNEIYDFVDGGNDGSPQHDQA